MRPAGGSASSPRAQVKIVSDGAYPGTHVYVDGHELRCVRSATWRVGPEPGLARATLELDDIAVEVGGDIDDARIVNRLRPLTRLGRLRQRMMIRRNQAELRRLERQRRRKIARGRREAHLSQMRRHEGRP